MYELVFINIFLAGYGLIYNCSHYHLIYSFIFIPIITSLFNLLFITYDFDFAFGVGLIKQKQNLTQNPNLDIYFDLLNKKNETYYKFFLYLWYICEYVILILYLYCNILG